MIKIPLDYMIYYCIYCKHHWRIQSDRAITADETETWFKEVSKHHLEICKIYRENQKS